jgi:hypothetical protein
LGIEHKLKAFSALGITLTSSLPDEIIEKAIQSNNWFTRETIQQAAEGIAYMLEQDKLENWTRNYVLKNQGLTVGLILAGNIPLVGFHDILCVLMSGNKAMVKLSSKDSILIPWIMNQLIDMEPGFNEEIKYVDQLKNFDVVIATGSDNSANYFNQYFSRYPNIIRKNRSSCAIITGQESDSHITALGEDIFSYYGLGCRNVSKIFVPENYKFEQLLALWSKYSWVIDHHKYANNYDYNKSIMLVNKEPHLDNGFLLVRESSELVSPISMVYMDKYSNTEHLKELLQTYKNKIQCIVGTSGLMDGEVEPGKAQQPELWDYADHIDTMKFLCDL